MPVAMKRQTVLGFAAILLWSLTVALARRLAEGVGPLTAGAAVYLAAGIILLAVQSGREGILAAWKKLPRKYLFGCGSLFVLYTLSLFAALGLAQDRLQAIAVGLLNYLWPALTLLFSLFILGHRARAGIIPGTLLALAGVFLVLTAGGTVSLRSFASGFAANPAAHCLGLAAACSWALYSNLARRWGGSAGNGAVAFFCLATGIVFLVLRIFRAETGFVGTRPVAELGLLALATSLGYLFWDMAMRRGDIVLVAAASYLAPLLSTLASSAYLGVAPGSRLWLGCLLLIAGSFLSWLSLRSR